jgi:hypothetical protein
MNRCRHLVVMLLAGLCLTASAARDAFNVDCFFGWGGCYRPMEWTPLEINIASQLDEPFDGTLRVAVAQDEMNSLHVIHGFAVTPDMPMSFPLTTKIAFGADICRLRITNEQGRTYWTGERNLYDFRSNQGALDPINKNDLLIGLVGDRSFGLPALAQNTLCQGPKVYGESKGKVYVKYKLARLVPWDWTGYVSLDVLVLYNQDLAEFRPDQLRGIAHWVSNGGRLLLVLGSHPFETNNALAEFLPFEIDQPQEVTVSQMSLRDLQLTPADPVALNCQFPRAKTPLGVHTLGVVDANSALFSLALAGFGRVGVLAFDPATLPTAQRERRVTAGFWTECISKLMATSSLQQGRSNRTWQDVPRTIQLTGTEAGEDLPSRSNRRSYSRNQHELPSSQRTTNKVLEHLYGIAEMRPLSVWWIILLLGVLALLLGPVDYLILKRLDKLPWTWVTCAFWIVLFTLGAYYGVQFLRAGKMQYRTVTVTDAVARSPFAWQTTYSGLFAPRSASYTFEGPVRPQWWSGISPSQEHQYNRGSAVGRRDVFCVQQDGGNTPYAVPVNIWTMQCLLTETVAPELPFTARVRMEGRTVHVTLDNRGAHPIKQLFVMHKDRKSANAGPVGPGNRFEQAMLTTRSQWRYEEYSSGNLEHEYAFGTSDIIPRTAGIQHYLDAGAVVICAEYDQAPVPWTVAAKTCDYDHVQLVRLVVFPQEQED